MLKNWNSQQLNYLAMFTGTLSFFLFIGGVYLYLNG